MLLHDAATETPSICSTSGWRDAILFGGGGVRVAVKDSSGALRSPGPNENLQVTIENISFQQNDVVLRPPSASQ